jgi:hypothetical protein
VPPDLLGSKRLESKRVSMVRVYDLGSVALSLNRCPSPYPAVDENVAADQDPELLGRLDNYVEKVKDLEK